MSCTRCLSLHQTELNSEINLRFRGLPNLGETWHFCVPPSIGLPGLRPVRVCDRNTRTGTDYGKEHHAKSLRHEVYKNRRRTLGAN